MMGSVKERDMNIPGLPSIPLKAVLTPSNMKWTAVQLHNELKNEHEAFRRSI